MDYPYLIYYLTLILLAFLYRKYHDRSVVSFTIVLTFVFYAFRAPVVGADTWNYVRYLDGERSFYSEIDARKLEPLFVLYREFLCRITESRFVIMVINTILSLAPIFYITKKYSKNPPLTVLLFSFFGVMSIYFCALRQILSLSILYFGLLFFLESQQNIKKKSIVLIVCGVTAYFFHTSSIVYFVLILLSLIPITKKWIYYALITGSALLGFIFKTLSYQEILNYVLIYGSSTISRIAGYADSEEYEGIIGFTFLIRMSIIAVVSIYFTEQKRISHPFIKLFVFGVVIFNLIYSIPMVHRIVNPLYFFGAVCFTWIIKSKHELNKQLRILLNVIIIVVVLYFARFNFAESMVISVYNEAKMHPYYFFFEDYSDHPSIRYF